MLDSEAPLVVRSTLPPGATRLAVEWADIPTARVLTNPEFLRQGTALEDFLHRRRVVVGHFPDADPATIARVVSVYEPLGAPILVMDVAAAEIAKNGANAFLALKLSFANEIASVAEEFGTDVDAVLEAMTLDPRIGGLYLRPGLASGSCLPKELRALAVGGHGARPADARHERRVGGQRRPAGALRRAHRRPGRWLAGTHGRAARPGLQGPHRRRPRLTATGRRAELLERGAEVVVAHDPQAAANAARELPELRFVDDPAHGVTQRRHRRPWDGMADLSRPRLGRHPPTMRTPTIIDGRRLLDGARLRDLGFRYEVVGTASAA